VTDILFGQSYYLHFDPKLWEAMQPYPPLGTLYAASFMRQQGYTVALSDSMLAESTSEWATSLDFHQPRYAIIYEDNFNYLSKMCLLAMRNAAFEMIQMGKSRRCVVIVAGSDVTDRYTAYLDAGADYVLIGEGEETLRDLIKALDANQHQQIGMIQGLAYHDASGEVIFTGRRPDIKDLDALPFPARDLVDIPRYQKIWREQHGHFSINLATTRGCPFHCNWCAKPIWGQRYNTRSPENVVAEMKQIKDEFAPDHIWFADDIFGLKPGWVTRFSEALNAIDAHIPFKCLSRADLLVREGEVEALSKAGCQIVWIGAESGSQKVLDAMDKGIRVEQIYEARKQLRAAGIRAGFFLQFGYPGETREDIELTLKMVRETQPDDIGISVSYPLPGTRFHAAVSHELGQKQNWDDSSDLAMLYGGPFSTDFYRYLYTVVHKEFRARQTWHRIRSGAPVGVRPIAAMVYHWISLPAARRKLDQISRANHRGVSVLPQLMRPEEAALPSPQEE
jgi:anaerobic magnesium-protoporphyrin IX monomethyl ester cyclase